MDALENGRGPSILRIPARLLEQMRAQVSMLVPEEACGLLAGLRRGDKILAFEAIPVVNALHSPVRYRMDPSEQLAAFNHIDDAGLELVGIYHSHPAGPSNPSATDLAEAFYPEVLYLIWSPGSGGWECRAFALEDGAFRPVNLEIEMNS